MNFIWSEELEHQCLKIFKDLIKIDSSNPGNYEKEVANYIIKTLEDENVTCSYHENAVGRGNVVALIDCEKKTDFVFLSHIDVVPADASKWKHNPFGGEEINQEIWGRGTIDTKQLTAIGMVAIIYLNKYKDKLSKNIYFVASADEEMGSKYGMEFLSNKVLNFKNSGQVISEGGGFPLLVGENQFIPITAGEKGVCSIKITSKSDENGYAIFKLLETLNCLASFEKKVKYTDISREIAMETGINPNNHMMTGDIEQDKILKYMFFESFHINEIFQDEIVDDEPTVAYAKVDFKFFPDEDIDEVLGFLDELLSEYNVVWEVQDIHPGYQSKLKSNFFDLIQNTCLEYGSEAKLIPIYALGRTDGRFLSETMLDTYGFSPMLISERFTEVLKRVHNENERISKDSFVFCCKVLLCLTVKWCLD